MDERKTAERETEAAAREAGAEAEDLDLKSPEAEKVTGGAAGPIEAIQWGGSNGGGG
jgi:hypothetical protein